MAKRRYNIRKADLSKEADRVTLNTLQARLLPWDHLYRLEGDWWIAECNGKPVGLCALDEDDDHEHSGYLARAMVVKAHRGNGLQRRFLKLRERVARKKGFKTLYSTTVTDNVPSSNNLIAEGFTLYTPKRPYGSAQTLYWKKTL